MLTKILLLYFVARFAGLQAILSCNARLLPCVVLYTKTDEFKDFRYSFNCCEGVVSLSTLRSNGR